MPCMCTAREFCTVIVYVQLPLIKCVAIVLVQVLIALYMHTSEQLQYIILVQDQLLYSVVHLNSYSKLLQYQYMQVQCCTPEQLQYLVHVYVYHSKARGIQLHNMPTIAVQLAIQADNTMTSDQQSILLLISCTLNQYAQDHSITI